MATYKNTHLIMLFFLLPLISCLKKEKKGISKIIFETTKDTSNIKFENVPEGNFRNQDSVYLRLMTNFSNDKIIIKIGNSFYKEINNISTDISVAFTTTIAVPISNAKEPDIRISLRDYYYLIPVKQKYHFIDLYIDKNDILTAKYNNSIVLLSSL